VKVDPAKGDSDGRQDSANIRESRANGAGVSLRRIPALRDQLLLLLFLARLMALSVQDRVIRLEEQMRMRELLPADLTPRINEFTVKQLVGLRFASDAELPELARQVLDGKLVEQKAIKQAVKNWRADHQRA
jgi:hypothetical protein